MGFWAVRKLVLTEDGEVDIGVSHFVAWSIRIVAGIMILQVSHSSHKLLYNKDKLVIFRTYTDFPFAEFCGPFVGIRGSFNGYHCRISITKSYEIEIPASPVQVSISSQGAQITGSKSSFSRYHL